MKSINIAGLSAALLVTAIATPALAENATPPGSALEIPAPPAGKGQIVFFRPSGMGFAIGCSVNESGSKISSLGAGKYFVLVTDPGKHEYSVKSEAKDVLTIYVEPEETQYANCRIKMGILVGRPDLAPASAAEFVDASPKLKLVDDDDMVEGTGALNSAQMAAALGESEAAEAGDAGGSD